LVVVVVVAAMFVAHSSCPPSLSSPAPVVLPRPSSSQCRYLPRRHLPCRHLPSSNPSPRSRRSGPKIVVKKEPGSPDLPSARPRPKRLDLSKGGAAPGNSGGHGAGPGTGRPLTARDGGLGIQDVGIACLSPGFMTNDPRMNDKLQKSLSVKEQQRSLIERRLQQSAKGDGSGVMESRERDGGSRGGGGGLGLGGGSTAADAPGPFTAKTPGMMSRRAKAPPPGLSIVAPSHEQFAHERVIQSAPLGHSFTGRHHPHPMTRHVANQPSGLSNTSHIHNNVPPAPQTANRLPPISDVFGQVSGRPENAPGGGSGGGGGGSGGSGGSMYSNPPAPSSSRPPASPNPHAHAHAHQQTHPHHPRDPRDPREQQQQHHDAHLAHHPPSHHHQQQHHPHYPHNPHHDPRDPRDHPQTIREYRSAEEAQAELSGGRQELLPKLVRYSGSGASSSNSSGQQQQQSAPPPPPPSHLQQHPAHMQPHHAAPSHPHHNHNHQQQQHPPTPPIPGQPRPEPMRSVSSGGRRRGRAEYEDGHQSPPLGYGPASQRHQREHYPSGGGGGSGGAAAAAALFGGAASGGRGERDSPDTYHAKREEFLSLCARAFDLLHS
jgi:hypothetical protein